MVTVHCFVWPSLVTVVSEAVRLNSNCSDILKILYPAICKCFIVFNAVYVLYGLVLFCKGDFHHIKCLYRMIFEGRILGVARKFHCNPYLNGTTVPFDDV